MSRKETICSGRNPIRKLLAASLSERIFFMKASCVMRGMGDFDGVDDFDFAILVNLSCKLKQNI